MLKLKWGLNHATLTDWFKGIDAPSIFLVPVIMIACYITIYYHVSTGVISYNRNETDGLLALSKAT